MLNLVAAAVLLVLACTGMSPPRGLDRDHSFQPQLTENGEAQMSKNLAICWMGGTRMDVGRPRKCNREILRIWSMESKWSVDGWCTCTYDRASKQMQLQYSNSKNTGSGSLSGNGAYPQATVQMSKDYSRCIFPSSELLVGQPGRCTQEIKNIMGLQSDAKVCTCSFNQSSGQIMMQASSGNINHYGNDDTPQMSQNKSRCWFGKSVLVVGQKMRCNHEIIRIIQRTMDPNISSDAANMMCICNYSHSTREMSVEISS